MTTPLDDLTVIEWGNDRCSYAGKLMADMGARVIKVEPRSGEETRTYPPFADNHEHPEKSLYFWSYNVNKLGVTLDATQPKGRDLLKKLICSADVVIESQPIGHPQKIGIDYSDIKSLAPHLIWASITPYGRNVSAAKIPSTDLTLAANGGFAWMNGYDDHTLPPLRGGGTQAYHTGCHYAFMSILVALLHKDITGVGQFIDVSINASVNVTTEAGSYQWLVANNTVQRQTGRHASIQPSTKNQFECKDGKHVCVMLAARKPDIFKLLQKWLPEVDEPILPDLQSVLEHIDSGNLDTSTWPNTTELIDSLQKSILKIAKKTNAIDFMERAQGGNIVCSVLNTPDEMLNSPHFISRNFPTPVQHLDRADPVTYSGAPYHFEKSPWQINRPPPQLGEHNKEIFKEIGLSLQDIDALQRDSII